MPGNRRSDAELLEAARLRHGGRWRGVAIAIGVSAGQITHYRQTGLTRRARAILEREEAALGSAPPLPVSSRPLHPADSEPALREAWNLLAKIYRRRKERPEQWRALLVFLRAMADDDVTPTGVRRSSG